MTSHTTHFDDCGCLSEKFKQEIKKKDEAIRVMSKALGEIDLGRAQTLLGRCCVEKRCVSSDTGASCELTEKVNAAFIQQADIASEALHRAKEILK